MLFRLLTFANVALALAAACFVYIMLPYAVGVRCEGVRQIGRTCGPISNTDLFLPAFAPVAIIAAITCIAFCIRSRYRRTGLLLLVLCPLAVGIRVLIVWAS